VAVDAVTQYLLNTFRIAEQASVGDNLFETKLLETLEHCQKAMRREGDVIDAHYGMGAEVTVAYVLWPHLFVVQAGKTSCSLLRNAALSHIGRPTSAELVGGVSQKLSPVFSNVELRLSDKLLVLSGSVRKLLDD